MNDVSIFETPEKLNIAAANYIVTKANKAIAEDDRFSIALSGGNTPLKIYHLLTTDEYRDKINWNKVFIFWGDERCVPLSDPANNAYQAKQVFLNHIPIPAENIFPIPVNLDPAFAAKRYEETIKDFFCESKPVFSLILLGMGDNGHTASLFPHTPILEERKAWVKEVYVPELNMSRVSFTLPLINQAKDILFIVSGAGKSSMLHTILEGKPEGEKYPAQLINPLQGNLQWFVDKEAAKKL